MPGLVIDASIVLAVMLPDEIDEYANIAIDAVAQGGAHAPIHWPLEIANGLLMAERRKRITTDIRRKSLEDTRALLVEIDGQTGEAVWTVASDLAAKYKLSIYDAAYLELARRLSLPLATLDDALRRAAPSEGVVIFGKA